MKVVIVTSIIGKREELSDPPFIHSDCEYIAFVDRFKKNIKIWKQIIVTSYSESVNFKDRIDSKLYKVLPEIYLPKYDYYAWVDAAHAYKISPKKLIKKYKDFDFLVFKHGKRTSVTSELWVVFFLGYDTTINLFRFFRAMRRSKYDAKIGLFELTAFIKKNGPVPKLASVSWFEYIIKFSSRDQLSFPLIADKFNLNLKFFDGKINTGKLFDDSEVVQYKEHISSGSGKHQSLLSRALIKSLFKFGILK